MTAPLPPFSGDRPTCPKCGRVGAMTRYRDASPLGLAFWNGSFMHRRNLPERLERQCLRCDYEWDEALNPPADTPPKDAP